VHLIYIFNSISPAHTKTRRTVGKARLEEERKSEQHLEMLLPFVLCEVFLSSALLPISLSTTEKSCLITFYLARGKLVLEIVLYPFALFISLRKFSLLLV
jgi:hypothetical protein